MTLADDLRRSATDAETLLALLDHANLTIADLTQQLADCQNPPPPPQTTKFGACPVKGGSMSDVVVKWGQGAAIRSFGSGSFTTPIPPTDAGPVHQSWKPPIGSPINGPNVAAACQNFRAGDYVEIWHEADVKFRNGTISASQAQQIVDMKNWFYDAVKSVRPDLNVATTYAAWMFESSMYPGTLADPATANFWSQVRADVVGIDCDAYQNLSKYPDFTKPVLNVQDYISLSRHHGYKGWAVPEFIHPRISSDPTGSQRAAWLTKWSQAFKDGGAAYVTAYDFNYRPNQEILVGSPEFTAFKAFVG